MVLVGLSTSLLGQSKYYQSTLSWANIHNGNSIVQYGNNYAIACETKNYTTNSWSSYVVIIDSTGDIIQNFTDETAPQRGSIYDIVERNGNFFAVGAYLPSTTSLINRCYVFTMLNNNELFYHPVGDTLRHNLSRSCAKTTDGNFLLAGYVDEPGTPPQELYLLLVDSIGNELWSRTYYAFTKNNSYEDIISLADGTFYGLATVRDDYWQQANVALLHLSSEGIPITIKEYDLGGRDLARCLIATHDGGVLFSASAYPTNDPTEVVQHLYKLDSSGTTQWINNADYFVGAVISSIVQLADSTYIVAGSDYSAGPNFLQGFIAKLDNNGQVLWRRSYGGNRDEYIYGMIANHQDASGRAGYVMCGRTESSDLGVPLGNANLYLLKTNCMGLLTEPQAAFSATMDTAALTASFQNLSQFVYPDSINGGHYIWEFGDGTVSSEINPTHTYAQEGVYLVKLTAVVCSDTSTTYQSICIGTSAHPSPSFSHNLQNDNLVTFTNTSSNAADAVFIWDFGDGTSSSEQNPTHTYTQAGEHEVRLSVVLCQDTTVFVQVVSTFAVGIPSMGMGEFMVYPNPAQDYLVIENNSQEQNATFVLYDVLGRQVLSVISHNQSVVPVEHLPSGVYLYQFLNPQNQIVAYGKVSVVR